MNRPPLALIVDPVSSGAMYPPILDHLGVSYVALDTDRALVAGLRSGPTPGALDFDIDFGGSRERLCAWAVENGVSYVVAAAESGMALCEYLRSALDSVPANSADGPEKRWNKEFIFAALQEKSVPTLRTVASTTVEDIDSQVLDMLDNGANVVVVKPSVGAGSVDVRLVDNEHDLREAVIQIVEGPGFFGDHPKALVQEAFPLPYREYVIDTFTAHGVHEIIAISVYDKHTSATGDFVYDRIRWLPPEDAVVPTLVEYAKQTLDALGVEIGPTHMEVMIGPNCGPRLIDFGARAHGAGHPAKTFHLTGTSQIHRECDYIAGDVEAAEMYRLVRHGAIVFFSTDHGARFDGSVGSEQLLELPG